MTQTNDIINRLATEAKPVTQPNPWRMLSLWLFATLISSMGLMGLMGLRPDLAVQLQQPLFLLEVGTLLTLILSTALAAVWLSFPDQRQQPWVCRLPLLPLAFYLALMGYRLAVPEATMPPLEKENGINCGLCLILYALVPATFLFFLVRRAATTTPRRTGMIAMLAAASIGHLVLKFIEPNDAVQHAIVWHITPVLLLGFMGGLLGKKYLAW